MRKILFITLAVWLALPAFAQNAQKEVTLTITRTINGVTTSTDTSFFVNDPSEVESILEQMGIDEPRENQTLEKRIVIRDVEQEGETMTFERAAPKPMIGVYLQEVEHMSREKRNELGSGDRGVYVTSLTKGGGAEAAGMKPGDVIMAIEGIPVNSSDEIGDVKSNYRAGDVVNIEFMRDGQRQNLDVQLGSRANQHKSYAYGLRNNQGGAMIKKEKSKPFLGVVPHTVDNELIREYRLGGAAVKGVFLSEIVEGSAAEKAGLQAKDVIVDINGNTIENNENLREAIKEAAEENDGMMRISYIRDGRRRTERVKLGEKTFTEKVWVSGDRIEKQKLEEKRAYLGVYLEADGNNGVKVTRPATGGAAEAAGIEAGDVIIRIDGEDTDNYNELVEVLRKQKPGEKVRIYYLRDGDRRSTLVTLGEKTMTKWIVKEKVKTQEIDIDVIIKEFENKDVAKALVEDMENPTLDMPEFAVFPNPSNGQFTLRFTPSEGSPIRIKIYDIKGRTLYQEQLTDFRGTYQKQLDISDNPAGTYFLQVNQNGNGMAKQLIVQK